MSLINLLPGSTRTHSGVPNHLLSVCGVTLGAPGAGEGSVASSCPETLSSPGCGVDPPLLGLLAQLNAEKDGGR